MPNRNFKFFAGTKHSLNVVNCFKLQGIEADRKPILFFHLNKHKETFKLLAFQMSVKENVTELNCIVFKV